MHFNTTGHVANSALFESLIAIRTSALPVLLHVIFLTEKILDCGVEVRLMYETTIRKNCEEILTRIKNICHWSHIAPTSAMNACMHSFRLPLIEYDLIPAAPVTQIGQHHYET